jgi:hypothetical protein
MTQGPPCPNCGSLLRWYPDQQQWGCDKCRVMYPPQVMVQPQAYASHPLNRPSKRRAMHGKALTWNKPVLYGLAAFVLVGAAVIVTLFMIHRGKREAGGYPDRDTAVRDTFSALSAGQLNVLMSHSGTGVAKAVLSCDEGKAPKAEDEAHDLADMNRAIDHAKGATFEIGELSEPDKPIAKVKGDSLMRGCKLVADLTTHEIHAKLKITRNGKTADGTAKLAIAEVRGRFYVMTPPQFGGCDGAAAWITLVAGRETEPAVADKLAAPITAACLDDKWPAPLIDCASNAIGIKDEHACFKDLEPAQRAHLAAVVNAALDQSPPAVALRAIVPTEDTPKPSSVTLGTPVVAGVADFWLTPRSDGTFLVTSPVVTAIFPAKPDFKVAPSSRLNADHKPFDIYTISSQPKGEPAYELQLIAMGRNMRDEGGFKNLETELGKLGKVEKANRTEDKQPITRFTVGQTFVLDGRIDLVRGLIINSSVNGPQTPASAAFLASVHVVVAPDPLDQAETLTGVRQRKGQKTKMVIHDADDHFTFEVPFNAKIDRKVDTDTHAVTVTIKKKIVEVTISELAPWDALAIGPTKLAELQAKAKPKAQLVWNPFQHRMFRFSCADEPCDPIVKSLRFTDPAPPK